MDRKYLLIGGLIGLLLILVIFIWSGQKNKTKNSSRLTPTPGIVFEPVEEDVLVGLKPNKTRTKVILEISGIKGRYNALEYELNYDTDKGPKGTLSGSKPVKFKNGQDKFTREIMLGTCSTGGKCTYHKGVKNFKLTIKFHNKQGIRFFQKEYDNL